MAFETVSTAAATAVVGYDLLQNSPFRQNSSVARTIHGVGYTGSAVVGDTKVQVRVGATTVANIYNSKLLTPDREDIFSLGVIVPAGTVVSAVIEDAPATNATFFAMDIR
jgi:hypothetical protein